MSAGIPGGSFGSLGNGFLPAGGVEYSGHQTGGIGMFGSAGGVGYSPSSAANGSDDLSMQKEDFPALPGSATKSTPEQLQYQQSFGSLISGGSLFNGGGGFNLNAADNQSFPSLQASLGASSEAVKSPAGTMMGGSSNSVIGSNGNSVRGSSQVSGGSADGSQTQGGSSNSTMGSLIGNSGSEGGTTAAAAVVAAAGVKPSSAHSDSSIGGGLESKFGLSGLLDIIRLTDKDLNALALGTDLTTFGLNLNSTGSLFSTFSSPFTDKALSPDPQYRTPSCYMMHPPSLKSEHLAKFQLETLFYMFYSMPKDILQACAAQELYRREWRYHEELKVWLKPRSPQELMQSHPSVQFLYFDCSVWETRLFTAPRGNLAAGLLTEEDVRVKAPQPPQGAS